MCFAPQTAYTFSTSEPPKVVRTWCALHILTWKCASRHNGVHFFNISTSENGVFCTFWLRNVLRTTTACTFSTSQLPKLLRTRQFLTHFTSKCASRHNAVPFFDISTSKSGPALTCFVPFHFEIGFAPQRRATFHLSSSQMSPHPAALASLLFNPPEPQNHEKTQCFATFLPFRAPASSFFWSFLFWLFSLLTAFSSPHTVGSLTSKLPSMIQYLKVTINIHQLLNPSNF